MACSEYHSPNFSEDPAWLPAWLQPYEQTTKEIQGQNHGNAIPLNACQFLQQNLYEVGNPQFNTSGDAKYTSCNLYLSGDDYPQVRSASCSNAMNFHLHLSSASISQVWSGQSNEIPYLHEHEMDKCSSQKSVSENPVITHGLAYQYSRGDAAPRHDSLPAVFMQNMSYEPNTYQPILENHNNEQEYVLKLDSEGLKCTVDDLVELSIAASEALVISELVFSNMYSESFSDAAILEIALRLKQARNECLLETPHAFSSGDSDDVDQIFDLDENSMSDAFEDVGIVIQQLVKTSNCRHSSKNTQVSDTKQQEIVKSDPSYGHNILGVDYGYEKSLTELNNGANTCRTSFKKCSPLDCKLQSNIMEAESHIQLQKNSLDNLLLDPVPYLKENSPAQAQKCHRNAFPANQIGSMEHHCIQKVGKVSEPSTAKVKNSMKMFNWETSFLSESMDSLDQDVSQKKPSVELEIVSSSNKALQVSSSSLPKEKEHNPEAPPTQYSRSLSLADPLCSIVPCSISSGVATGYESMSVIDAAEKSKNPMTLMNSKYLDGDSTIQNNIMLHKSFFETGDFIYSEAKFERHGVPHRKELNSLRLHSLIEDNHKKAEGSNSPCKKLHDINGAVIFSSSEVVVECSNINDIELPGNCLFTDKPNNEQIFGQVKIGVPSLSFGYKENDGTPSPVLNNAVSPRILGCMNHTREGCKITTGIDRNESSKRSPTSDLGTCRLDDSTKEASYRIETNNKCNFPIQSNSHSYPAAERLKKKRVRFQEGTCNLGVPKTSSLKCSCSRPIEQLQYYSLLYKPESGKDQNINYLSCNREVRNRTMILQGLEFLLTGFSSCKAKDLDELIRRHGGYVLQNIPSVSLYLKGKSMWSASKKLPVVLCPKPVQTTKFLYGCAVNSFILNYRWLEDSVVACAILPPDKYMIRSVSDSKGNKLIIGEAVCISNNMPILNKVGVLVHGKVKFCARFIKIIKHGGGQVFKSLQRLVQSLKNGANTSGIILVKNESCVSRHLKHCALEHHIPTMPASWIISSLFAGKLLPPKKDRCALFRRIKMPSFPKPPLDEMSQEI